MTRSIDLGMNRDGSDAALDIDDYRRTGFRAGIFGASGTGKGWVLGKIIEGFIEHRVPVLMVDAEQELWTFKELGGLVIGGKHADAPFVEDRGAIDAVIRFCLTTGTPVVFDIGQVAEAVESEASRLADLIAQRVWAIEDDLRIDMLFAATEASIVAPQTVVRGGEQRTTLRQMFQRGRKRGVNVAIETQRLADIQKACISQANVRLFGAINTADDWAAVGRNLPGRTFAQQQAQPPGTFYVVPGGYEVRVGPRRVTHGGGGPEAGDIQIRETARTGLDDVLALLNRAAQASGGQSDGSDSSPSNEAEKQEPRGRYPVAAATAAAEARAEARVQEAGARAQAAERALALAQEGAQAAQAARDAAMADAAALRERLGAYDALAAGLRAVVGNVAIEAAPFDEGTVRRIVRAEMGNGTGPTVPLVPQGALRERYMEQAAQRLVERVRGLQPDEREALLFLLAHPDNFQTINAITVGITGNDGGAARARFSKAAQGLVAAGLVQVGGSSRARRKPIVDQWVRSALGPHNPTDDDIARVRDRALEVVLIDEA